MPFCLAAPMLWHRQQATLHMHVGSGQTSLSKPQQAPAFATPQRKPPCSVLINTAEHQRWTFPLHELQDMEHLSQPTMARAMGATAKKGIWQRLGTGNLSNNACLNTVLKPSYTYDRKRQGHFPHGIPVRPPLTLDLRVTLCTLDIGNQSFRQGI